MMNQTCKVICCLGVLVALGLAIWVLVKQHDCCKKSGGKKNLAGIPPPQPGTCASGTVMSFGKDEGKCNQCFDYWNPYYPGSTFFCKDAQGNVICNNEFNGTGSGCPYESLYVDKKSMCGSPQNCAAY